MCTLIVLMESLCLRGLKQRLLYFEKESKGNNCFQILSQLNVVIYKNENVLA